jgi:integrase
MKRKHNLPAGVSVDFDRHGNPRFYFRRLGAPKIRLRETPGTDAFKDEVACARLGLPYKEVVAKQEADNAKAAKDSLRWLVDEYERRNRKRVTADLMDRRYRMLIEICDTAKGNRLRGTLPYSQMQRRHVIEIRDGIRDTPGAQNNVVKALSAMFTWAVKADLLTLNPCAGIERLKSGDGFHTWTPDEVAQFELKHPLGTKARLALHLGLFTGLRLSDIAIVGRQHVKDSWLKIRPGKTAGSSGVTVEIPVLSELQETIDATDTGDLAFLVTEWGRPFSVDGLGNKMRQWCDQAELFHCTMHGLRKAGATIAAENGATDDELMAIFGWTTKQQTTLYTRQANRKKLAGGAMHKLRREQNLDKVVPPAEWVGKSGTKTGKKRKRING